MKYPPEVWGPIIEARVRALLAEGRLRASIVRQVSHEIRAGVLRPEVRS
jgi:hypothetical protein